MKGKLVVLCVMMAAVMLLLTACGGKGIEGTTWKYIYDAGSYYTFSFSNGICTETYVNIITGEHQSNSYPYTVSGDRITMNGESAAWEIKGNNLILTLDGIQTVFERNQ